MATNLLCSFGRQSQEVAMRAERQAPEHEDVVSKAIANAKFKTARLRLMKARNERYLAEQRLDDDRDSEEETKEL
jgi:hypothetical protein